MSAKKSLTFALMDAPYEQARTTTAFRLLDIAVRRGYEVNVFCYEGAAALAFARQAPHPNAIHGRDAQQEAHPNPKDWVAALLEASAQAGGKLTWLNCGLCVDERGVGESIPGVNRGSPADFWKMAEASDSTAPDRMVEATNRIDRRRRGRSGIRPRAASAGSSYSASVRGKSRLMLEFQRW